MFPGDGPDNLLKVGCGASEGPPPGLKAGSGHRPLDREKLRPLDGDRLRPLDGGRVRLLGGGRLRPLDGGGGGGIINVSVVQDPGTRLTWFPDSARGVTGCSTRAVSGWREEGGTSDGGIRFR